jgi:hypothetical protein
MTPGREFRYRKHIRWGQYALPILFVLLAATIVVWGLTGSYRLGLFPLVVSCPLAVITLLGGAATWFINYRLAGTRIVLEADGLTYKFRGGEKRIPFENITRLEFASLPYTGGWATIVVGADKIRLTVVFEELSELLQEVKAALDKRGLSDRYDTAKYLGFLKTAAYADHSWSRVYDLFSTLIGLGMIVAAMIINLAIGYYVAYLGFNGRVGVIIWIGVSMLWPLFGFLIAELLFLRRFSRGVNLATLSFPPRDEAYEKRIFSRVFVLGAVSYLVVTSLVLALVIVTRFMQLGY